MATLRNDPYLRCNFLVDIGTGVPISCHEVVLPRGVVDVVAYRNGNDKAEQARQIPGLHHTENVVLKRGVNGSLDLAKWYRATTEGGSDFRNVSVTLLDETGVAVLGWKVFRAFPAAYGFEPLDATSSDPVVEILELACDGFELE